MSIEERKRLNHKAQDLPFNVQDFLRYEQCEYLPLTNLDTSTDDQSFEAMEERAFMEAATKECAFYLIGIACGKKIGYLTRLQCQCTKSCFSCHFCNRAHQLEAGVIQLTFNELRQVLEWVDVNSWLSQNQFGRKIVRGSIDNLASLNWASPEVVCMVGDKIAQYTVTKVCHELARQRLVFNLSAMAKSTRIKTRSLPSIPKEDENIPPFVAGMYKERKESRDEAEDEKYERPIETLISDRSHYYNVK